MSDAPLMLGVSGLRGIVGKSLTPEVAARFAGAFAGWLADRAGGGNTAAKIVLARDGRAGGELFYDATIAKLTALGCTVSEIGVAMTPTAGVAVDRFGANGAVIVTASHNPQEWNGLKLIVRNRMAEIDASAPDPSTASEIITRFHGGTATQSSGTSGTCVDQRSEAYGTHGGLVFRAIRSCGATIPLARSFRVVVDSVNGAGAIPAAGLMAAFGCTLHHIGKERSGLFPHPPEPTRENLTGLCATVREHHADIGFAQDPDGDRLAIIDERGEYIGEEYTLVLAAEALLAARDEETKGPRDKRGEPVLVTNLSTSRMLDDIAARHGARVVRTPVGEANVVEAMKRETAAGHNVILGGEGNGGVIWPKVTYVRDSLSAMALTLALMARTGKKVSELVAAIPAYAIEKRKVDIARKEDATPAIERIAAHYAGRAPPNSSHPLTVSPSHRLNAPTSRGAAPRIDRQDGVRVDLDDRKAWLHVRPSNTEPIMRLIAEAPTAAEAKSILDEAARVAQGA